MSNRQSRTRSARTRTSYHLASTQTVLGKPMTSIQSGRTCRIHQIASESRLTRGQPGHTEAQSINDAGGYASRESTSTSHLRAITIELRELGVPIDESIDLLTVRRCGSRCGNLRSAYSANTGYPSMKLIELLARDRYFPGSERMRRPPSAPKASCCAKRLYLYS
jgi:hypothetical protein